MANIPPNKIASEYLAGAGRGIRGPGLPLTDEQARNATGTNVRSLQQRMLNQTFLASTLSGDADHDEVANASLAALEAIGPTDGLEGMLATQMVATHEAAMECLRLANSLQQSFEVRSVNLKHAEKLLLIYTRQMEALAKNRGRGPQKITVEHVSLHAGGQAIVGNLQAPEARRSLPDQMGSVVPLPDDLAVPRHCNQAATQSGER